MQRAVTRVRCCLTCALDGLLQFLRAMRQVLLLFCCLRAATVGFYLPRHLYPAAVLAFTACASSATRCYLTVDTGSYSFLRPFYFAAACTCCTFLRAPVMPRIIYVLAGTAVRTILPLLRFFTDYLPQHAYTVAALAVYSARFRATPHLRLVYQYHACCLYARWLVWFRAARPVYRSTIFVCCAPLRSVTLPVTLFLHAWCSVVLVDLLVCRTRLLWDVATPHRVWFVLECLPVRAAIRLRFYFALLPLIIVSFCGPWSAHGFFFAFNLPGLDTAYVTVPSPCTCATPDVYIAYVLVFTWVLGRFSARCAPPQRARVLYGLHAGRHAGRG